VTLEQLAIAISKERDREGISCLYWQRCLCWWPSERV